MLLADLAEATGGITLQASGQTEISAVLTPDQVKATRDKIAAKFQGSSSELTPLQGLLKWSVSDPRNRTISPSSHQTVAEWIENTINKGTLDGLRSAIQVDPANGRLAAHFAMALANLAVGENNSDAARRARAEADYQSHRAVTLASDKNEVQKLRGAVVKMLGLTSN